ncbi:MAG: stage 0 sporulation family protein [Deltaproteobacteria bacterium]|nr:stage 0 sporulation family protein [Deltaproteobacteria bacterium]
MKHIVGVKFKKEGKIYSFHAADLPLKKNDQVIVDTENGVAMGTVATEVQPVPASKLPVNLKNITRKATEEDLKIREDNERLEQEARQHCLDRITERNLPMKLTEVECFFDKSKIIFYFTAENRVDFRDLVKDLVQKFKTRIELRQIGARQEARITKGLAICGREVCCASLLHNLDRVSVKMAKEQSMSLNPEKISGLCGRLMCCLAFEYDGYVDMKKNMPKCGKMIDCPEGRGKVIRQNVLQGEIAVELENGKEIIIHTSDL